jgi:hypothetical protein
MHDPSRARVRQRLAGVVGVAALVVGLTAERSAHAFEKQFHLGASFGYAGLFGDTFANGFGGGVHFAYGVNDYINLMAEVDATAHPSSQYTVVTSGFGASYVLDVLRWVPWAGLEVGPAALVSFDPKCGAATTEPCAGFRLNGAIPFGLDYQVSRSFAVGVMGRFQILLLGGAPQETLGAFARAEYTWGY